MSALSSGKTVLLMHKLRAIVKFPQATYNKFAKKQQLNSILPTTGIIQ